MARTRAQAKDTDELAPSSPAVRRTTRSSKKELIVNDVPVSIIFQRILIGATTSILTMVLLGYTVWTGKISLTGNFATEKMTGFGSKLEFTLRFLILPTAWLLINDLAVMITRVVRPEALDPLNEREDLIQVSQNVLRNTCEQLLLTVLTQLSLISYASGEMVARVIPLMNVTFFVGRLAYFIGYPRYRTFGFAMTFLPTASAVSFVVYKFVVTTFLSG